MPVPKSTKKAKQRKRLGKALLAMSLFLVSGLFLSGYMFYNKLTSEYASAFSSSSYSILNEEIYSSSLIVVESFIQDPIKVKKIHLYIFDKSTLKLIKYNIPLEVEIDVPGRFGTEPFANIFALGNLEENDLSESANLVSKAIFKLLAFPVDRYMVVDSGGEELLVDLFNGKLNVNIQGGFDPILLKESVKTNLTLRELFDVYSFTRSLPKDRMLEKDISATYLENPHLLDEEFLDLTFASPLSNEKKSIAVLNGTNMTGIAGFASRVIKNAGGRIVAIGNTKEIYEDSLIIVDDVTTESTRIISNLFGIENVILKSEAGNFSENEISRSEITIIFGLDFASSL